MKKLAILVLVAMAVPAIAAVNFSAVDAGDGKVAISYESDPATDLPRGVALRISLSDGATVALDPAPVVAAAFNTYIDWAYSNAAGYDLGMGHPLALVDGPGALTAPASVFSLSMGVLDPSGNQGAGPVLANPLAVLQLVKGTADYTDVTISADTLRGPDSGVVGSVLSSNLPLAAVRVNFQVECVKATAPIYAAWVAFGKPDCWCYARNCRGDADGKSQGSAILGFSYVFSNDLNVVIAGWNVKEPPKGPGILSITNGICGDFARDQQGSAILGYARVFSNDLNILIANWNIKEAPKGPGIADCSDTGHYNRFVTP